MRNRAKKIIKPIFILSVVSCLLLLATGLYVFAGLPDEISYFDSANLNISGIFPVKAVRSNLQDVGKNGTPNPDSYLAELKLFGVIPIKTATVTRVEERQVQLLGTPFGMKIYAEGVMIVGMSDVDTAKGSACPAKEGGLEIGDIIISVDGTQTSSNSDVAKAMEKSGGKTIAVKIKRKGNTLTMTVTPAYSESEGCYKLGAWVRDSSAGIGTLTFYDPSRGIIAGLGHGITDSSTGDIIPISDGEFVGAEVISLEKSFSGDPGELHARFTNKLFGDMLENCGVGVYGKAKSVFATDRLYTVALKQEILQGDAEIFTTIEGEEPKAYSCKIEKIYLAGRPESQDMVIRITDKELLEKCGGIVQGMSGSPIIQNGKLVGAVTHVFVNSPEKGYAVFAETMLEKSEETYNMIVRKQAS